MKGIKVDTQENLGVVDMIFLYLFILCSVS